MNECLFQGLSYDKAHEYAFVLSTQGKSCILRNVDMGWEIWVADPDLENARRIILEYEFENSIHPPQKAEKKSSRLITPSALWIGGFLIICHIGAHSSGQFNQIVKRYGASAADILNGEMFRLVTALFLHGDISHLVGNLAGVLIFGSSVIGSMGTFGWPAILVSGIMGNLLNAVFFQAHHTSIGASTAIFGALGIMSACSFFLKQRTNSISRRKAWVSIGAGLALLAFLGASPQTDIMAHLFGFISGVGVGYFFIRFYSTKYRKKNEL